MSQFSYRVPGIISPILQPSDMTCWAAVTSMMTSWRQNQSWTIETALANIGQTYLDRFEANRGLSSADKGPFLDASGMQAEPPLCYSRDGWLELLRNYGPLWVTTDEDPTADFAIHARIMAAISSDGTDQGTSFQIVDPATGTEYPEALETFTRKFEEEAMDPDRPVRVQVVHWPVRVTCFATAQSCPRENMKG